MYRDHTKVIQIGDRKIGGGNPILIQSMTNTKTEDVEQTVAQILALEQAGCDIIRCAVPTMEAAKALKEIKKQIQNWKPNLSGSTTFYGKLTTFRAEKNGTVYVKWTSSDTANGEFFIYHKAPLSIVEAPDQSELGSSIPKGLQQEDFCYYHINYVYSSNKGKPTTFEWVFPVIDYTFMWYASSASSLYLNEFSLGYTDTKEA